MEQRKLVLGEEIEEAIIDVLRSRAIMWDRMREFEALAGVEVEFENFDLLDLDEQPCQLSQDNKAAFQEFLDSIAHNPSASGEDSDNRRFIQAVGDSNELFDRATIFRTARRCIRVFCGLLHSPQRANLVDLSSLSNMAVAVLREMVIEMYDSYPLMEVGNCVLFINDEIQRRKKLAGPESDTAKAR